MKKLAALALTLCFGAAFASDYPRVDADIKAYDEHVAALNAEFVKTPPAPRDKEWVKAKLKHMVAVDQYMRGLVELPNKRKYTDDERSAFSEQQMKRWQSVDATNTAELKALMKVYPWFTISEFGSEASQNAWLLVQHADQDAPFQRQVLTILEPLAAKGETNPKNFAYLFDRVASSFQNPAGRKPQRYGTQGVCTGPGTWEPLPVENPEKLDERRATMGLSTMAEYKTHFVNLCHESVDESIRRSMEAKAAPQQPPH